MSDLQRISNIEPNLTYHYVEREAFNSSLVSLRKAVEKLRTEISELANVIQEVENRKAEIELLKMAINNTAIEFGLEPMKDETS